jgi:hypothetical protein
MDAHADGRIASAAVPCQSRPAVTDGPGNESAARLPAGLCQRRAEFDSGAMQRSA